MIDEYQNLKDRISETDAISAAAHEAMVALTELFSNLPKSYNNHRTYVLELENGNLVFRREELDLAFDDAMEKVFGPGPGNDGDDIVPQKLAKQFPGRSSRNPDR
jgi:hypothetical protein